MVLWSVSSTKMVSINDSCDYPFQKLLWDEENYTVQSNAPFLEAVNTIECSMVYGERDLWSTIPAPKPSVMLAEASIATTLLFTSSLTCSDSHIFIVPQVLTWVESPFFSVSPRELCLLWFANRMQTMEKDTNQKFYFSQRTVELLSIQDGGNGGRRANC